MNHGIYKDHGVTPTDLRTAAKVLRVVSMIADRHVDSMPFFKRMWWRLTRENTDDMLRRSSILEEIAGVLDILEGIEVIQKEQLK